MSEPSYLTDTRRSYDKVAANYADRLHDALDHEPVDRAVLALFAELAGAQGGQVADLGCGPGHVTAHLAGLGLDVFGVDLSPAMVKVAQCAYPNLSFRQGQLAQLDLADETITGVVAWYSIIHTPPEYLAAVFYEFARVLGHGGLLLLAFQNGDDRVHVTHAYDQDVSLDAWRLTAPLLRPLLAQAGMSVRVETVRAPLENERVPQTYLLAEKQ